MAEPLTHFPSGVLISTSRFLLSLAGSLALATFVSASDEPTLEQRLEELAESIETAREHAHIPGMAIAIVRGDDVVLARRGWLNKGSTLRGNPSSPSFWRCCVRAMRSNGSSSSMTHGVSPSRLHNGAPARRSRHTSVPAPAERFSRAWGCCDLMLTINAVGVDSHSVPRRLPSRPIGLLSLLRHRHEVWYGSTEGSN